MRPLVISHAACGGHAPENTLAGIRAALRVGADAIEIDVQASSDGVPVLMHDLTVDRSTNGRGAVASMTLEQLRALDAGGEPVSTLDEVLALTIGRALLIAPQSLPEWPQLREQAVSMGLQGVSVFHLGTSEQIVFEAQRSGLALYVWTADLESDITRLIDLGVDGICSNLPDRVVALLAQR